MNRKPFLTTDRDLFIVLAVVASCVTLASVLAAALG